MSEETGEDFREALAAISEEADDPSPPSSPVTSIAVCPRSSPIIHLGQSQHRASVHQSPTHPMQSRQLQLSTIPHRRFPPCQLHVANSGGPASTLRHPHQSQPRAHMQGPQIRAIVTQSQLPLTPRTRAPNVPSNLRQDVLPRQTPQAHAIAHIRRVGSGREGATDVWGFFESKNKTRVCCFCQ
jgi:hypothetical protein